METITKNKDALDKTSRDLKIFVIEDDIIYRTAIEKYLRKNIHHKIYSFKTGEECFKHIRMLDPDIVILDYRLNDQNALAKNGLEVLKRLKIMRPELPVLMMSGQESFEIATSAIRFGAFDYIVKNESAFIRLQNLILKILHIAELKEWEKKQNSYINVIRGSVFLVPFMIGVTYYWFPNILREMLIGIILFLLVEFTIILTGGTHKTQGAS